MDPDKVSNLLKTIEKEIAGLPPAKVETKKDRAQMKKNAMLITRSKTLLDGYGKEITTYYKAIPKKIDSARKLIRDQLDEWRDDYRKPLTDWEENEQNKVDEIQKDINFFKNADNLFLGNGTITDSKYFEEQLKIVENYVVLETVGPFKAEIEQEKQFAIKALKVRIEDRKKHEADQAELEKLRKEKEEEREKKIAEDAEAKGKREAEQKAEIEEATKANEKSHKEAVAKRKAENVEHQRKINQEILARLVLFLSEDNAKQLIKLIATGLIPHVRINY